MKTDNKLAILQSDDARSYSVAVIKASWHTELLNEVSAQVHKVVENLNNQSNVDEYTVAGTLELPQMLEYIAKHKDYDAAVVAGCVIRGETSHYDHICDTVFPAIDAVARAYSLPVGNAILSVENLDQAKARVNGEHAYKGKEACEAALMLAQSYNAIKGQL